MVGVAKRMTKLAALVELRTGPGAAILPPNVKRIHMDFAFKIDQGHRGPRHFWRHYLPRLKYYNPAIPMTVHRRTAQDSPALMTIFFNDGSLTAGPATISTTTSSNTSTAPITPTTEPSVSSSSSSSSTPTNPNPTDERIQTITMTHRSEMEILNEFLNLTRAAPVPISDEDSQLLKDLKEKEKIQKADSVRSAIKNAAIKREKELLARARGVQS
ncbi:MAG: hypothetical protein M1823_003117 [Watsoniomyces obsoletus]|nr:MAG: hypothetical protein M1823_003117 [Watsoniomyces obsoletus]